MLQTILIVVHLMIVVALVGVVLLQRSEGGALGMGGGGGFMTGRGQANALTRATAILGAMFFATSLALTFAASYNRTPKSIFQPTVDGAASPAPTGNVLDQLKALEKDKSESAPAAPQAPRSQ